MNAVVSDLPIGWKCVPLKDVVHIILGQSPSSSTYNKEGRGLPFFQGKTEFGEIYPSVRQWCTEPKKIAEKEDVLVSVRAPVGPTNMAPSECAIGRGLAALRPLGGSDSKYFLYLIRRYQDKLAALGTGTTFEAISGDKLKNFVVPIAPIEQQKRIVAKIEELFSHIDAGIASLQAAKKLLKQYRQSVLKAAVTGELTKDWRKANKDKLEPASQLLERILKERRQRWEEQQLEQFKAKGKPPKDDKWKEKYKEPNKSIEAEPENIPHSWIWLTVEQLNPPDRPCSYGVLQPGPEYIGGIELIRVGDIQDGQIVFGKIKKINPAISNKYPRTELKGGEVVISLVGAIGRTAVVPSKLSGANTARAVGVIALLDEIFSEWVELWFRNPSKILEMTNKSHEVARKTLNLEDVRSSLVAIPSYEEQKVIVGIVEGKFHSLRRLEYELNHQLEKAEKNKQSILASAFNGNL